MFSFHETGAGQVLEIISSVLGETLEDTVTHTLQTHVSIMQSHNLLKIVPQLLVGSRSLGPGCSDTQAGVGQRKCVAERGQSVRKSPKRSWSGKEEVQLQNLQPFLGGEKCKEKGEEQRKGTEQID